MLHGGLFPFIMVDIGMSVRQHFYEKLLWRVGIQFLFWAFYVRTKFCPLFLNKFLIKLFSTYGITVVPPHTAQQHLHEERFAKWQKWERHSGGHLSAGWHSGEWYSRKSTLINCIQQNDMHGYNTQQNDIMTSFCATVPSKMT
jgi:hypothetical protein